MIRLAGGHKSCGREKLLSGVDLHVPRGIKSGLIGPGAAGNTVLLKLIAGLFAPDAGTISVDGKDLTTMDEDGLGELRQRIAMLFQNYALFDFMNVAENVAFPLVRRGGVPAVEIA